MKLMPTSTSLYSIHNMLSENQLVLLPIKRPPATALKTASGGYLN